MRLILLGPPGSGKGTQSKLLCRHMALEHIGTGDLLRAAIRNETPVGQRARPFVESGRLVPDEVVNDLISERFSRSDRPSRFVMDGYPRTVAQARAFDAMLALHQLTLSKVLLLSIDDQHIIQRLSGRWSCPQTGCKATYHTKSNPPKTPMVCDDCGAVLVQRDDDKEETVRARLVVYHRNTTELFPYYEAKGLLVRIPGQGEIDQIYNNIVKVLAPVGKK